MFLKKYFSSVILSIWEKKSSTAVKGIKQSFTSWIHIYVLCIIFMFKICYKWYDLKVKRETSKWKTAYEANRQGHINWRPEIPTHRKLDWLTNKQTQFEKTVLFIATFKAKKLANDNSTARSLKQTNYVAYKFDKRRCKKFQFFSCKFPNELFSLCEKKKIILQSSVTQ